ncbi:MAG: hypothetical protein U1F77_15425 [Kiritimatiellia bacterium]
MSGPDHPHLRRPWLVTVLACALALAVVSIALNHPMFVDDPYQIAYSGGFTSWRSWWGPDVFGYFRPVKNMLFHGIAWNPQPVVAHTVNLLLFLAAAAGMSAVARRALGDGPAPAAAALAWVGSPLLVSSAVWFSSANIMAMAALLFGALLLHDRARLFADAGRPGPSLAARGGAAGLFALALLSYEHAIAWPALVLLWDVRRGGPWRKWVPGALIHGAVAVLYLFARWKAVPDFQADPRLISAMSDARICTLSAYFFLYHLVWWLVPFGRQQLLVTFLWGESAPVWMVAAAWPVFLGYLALTAWAWRRHPWIGFGLAWYLVASIPTNNFLPLRNGPLADYYLVLPSIGLAIAFGAWMGGLLQPGGARAARGAALAGGLWLLACAATALLWSDRWNRPVDFFETSIRSHPAAFASRVALAEMLLDAGDKDRALATASAAVVDAPWSPNAHSTLASVHLKRGEYADTLREADACLALDSNHIIALGARGVALEELDRLDEAQDAYRALLRKPWGLNSEAIACRWTMLLLKHDLPDEALKILKFALERSPSSHKLHWYFAAVHRARGDEPAVIASYRTWEELVARRFPGFKPTGRPPATFTDPDAEAGTIPVPGEEGIHRPVPADKPKP